MSDYGDEIKKLKVGECVALNLMLITEDGKEYLEIDVCKPDKNTINIVDGRGSPLSSMFGKSHVKEIKLLDAMKHRLRVRH